MKKSVTGIVLILEITAICVLHAIKINQAETAPSQVNRKPVSNEQKDVLLRQFAFNKL